MGEKEINILLNKKTDEVGIWVLSCYCNFNSSIN